MKRAIHVSNHWGKYCKIQDLEFKVLWGSYRVKSMRN